MKLSICCITYNHGKFIRQALDGFQKQKTNFEIEIIICDDNSKDDTKEIISIYAANDPRIRFIANEKNIGMMPNFIQALQACTGNYIALCEGDDYWINENKLQKQVDFLEQHKDVAVCFHRAKLVYDEGISESFRDINKDTPQVTTLHDLVKGNYIHTPTCVFRKTVNVFPNWFVKVPTGDWVLHMLNAEHGNIYFMQEEMAAYRIHYGGVLSTIKPGGQHSLKKMEMYRDLAEYFRNKNADIHDWFKELHYHQKAFFYGIENVGHKKISERIGILFKSGLVIKKPKLFVAAILLPFLPGSSLSRLWSYASKKKNG